MRFYFCLFIFIYSLSIKAQLKVNPISGANEIMNTLLDDGENLTVSNVTINGDKKAFGIFESKLKYNTFFSNGIIMSTGIAKDAIGPNDDSKKSSKINFLSDKNINAIAKNKGCYDTALFEFDLVSETDEIQFRFLFASEEYPEYIFKNVNDVFIFLVTNLETKTSENIAILNGDPNTPITVDDINHKINSDFYVENYSYNLSSLEKFKDNNKKYELALSFQYDGFTTILVAKAKVVPNTKYHLKLGISDVGDQLYDSAMFLEANSLRSSGNKPKLKDDLADLSTPVSIDFSIDFEFDSDKIKGENSLLLLDDIITILKDNPQVKIEIIGHTDRKGNDLYNEKLSLKRAESVSDYIIIRAISKTRIKTKGMGEKSPKSINPIDNRRVEIIFSE